MNKHRLNPLYDRIQPQERFRLIYAASARDDMAEYYRLIDAAPRKRVSVPDYFGASRAFDEVSMLIFIELVDDARAYVESRERADDFYEDELVRQLEAARLELPIEVPGSPWRRAHDIRRASAYRLHAKAQGWVQCCESMTVPAFRVWELFPGYERLQAGIAMAEQDRFNADEMLAWLNRVRPKDQPPSPSLNLSIAGFAESVRQLLAVRTAFWNGDAPER